MSNESVDKPRQFTDDEIRAHLHLMSQYSDPLDRERYQVFRQVYDDLLARSSCPTIARNAALEEAAKACHVASGQPSSLWEEQGCWAHAAEYCAEQVRALKNAPLPECETQSRSQLRRIAAQKGDPAPTFAAPANLLPGLQMAMEIMSRQQHFKSAEYEIGECVRQINAAGQDGSCPGVGSIPTPAAPITLPEAANRCRQQINDGNHSVAGLGTPRTIESGNEAGNASAPSPSPSEGPTPVGKYFHLYREICGTDPYLLGNQECEVINQLVEWARSAGPPTREPVAWISRNVLNGSERYGKRPVQSLQAGLYRHTPLYAAPQSSTAPSDANYARMKEALRVIANASWSEEEPYAERVDDLQGMALEALNDVKKSASSAITPIAPKGKS